MPAPFLFAATYAFALAILILSHFATWAVLDLFLARPYTVGSHTIAWMNWHAIGCAFVGLINTLAHRWPDGPPRRQAAGATAAIFGIWALQNLGLVLGEGFTAFMWLHVIGCAVASAWSAAYARRAEA